MVNESFLLEVICAFSSEKGKKFVSANAFFMNAVNSLVKGVGIFGMREDDAEAEVELKALWAMLTKNGIDSYLSAKQLRENFPNRKDELMDSFLIDKIFREFDINNTNGDIVLTVDLVCEKILESPTAFIAENIVKSTAAASEGEQTQPAKPIVEDEDFDAQLEKLKAILYQAREAVRKKNGESKEESKEEQQPEQSEAKDDVDTRMDEILNEIFKEEDEAETDEYTVGRTSIIADVVKEVEEVRKFLTNSVYGQDFAISSFLSGYFQGELAARTQKKLTKPRATFLFAGPPGVGKTFLAEQAAVALKLPFQRFDMSEYCDKEANYEFCGSDKVYKNGKAGNVTSFVAEHPCSVLLFDEVEKAHTNVIYLFLQILDAGRIRDNYTDEEVSFADAIIIFTTNVGKRLYEDETVKLSAVSRKTVLRALASEINPETGAPLFPAAICSRFASGNVVMFNHMGVDHLLKVSSREIEKQVSGISAGTGIEFTVDEKIPYAILFSEGAKADARTIKGKSCNIVYQELYELYRLMNSESKHCDMGAIETIEFTVEIPEDKEVAKFYKMETRPSVLVFASDDMCKTVKSLLEDCDVHAANSIDEAKKIFERHAVDCVLCDIFYKCERREKLLNVDDIASLGREFLDYCAANSAVSVYVVKDGASISDEEVFSLIQSGANGVISLDGENADDICAVVRRESEGAYQKKCLLELARTNKILKYKTSQKVSDDGKKATITFFDIKKETAVDAGDNAGMLDAVSKPDLRFSDVIGAKDAKEELSYFVDYLKNPEKISKLGVGVPKGVLLYGPPGTGKTMLAKAMAGESDVTFIHAEGNQFLKRFVGEGADSVHKLFKTARKYAPSILFIDEIDAIAKERGTSMSAENTGDILTAFLTEMDGFVSDKTRPVFVLAATNYTVERGSAKSLDEALLRRFDRRIYIDLPDKEERLQFINKRISKIKNHSLTPEQIENIAMRSTGASLAELESVFALALRNVIKSKGYVLTDKILDEAFETFNGGEVKQWSKDELLRTARHEAGHALMCRLGGEKPSYLTIVARGNHGGYMQHDSQEDKGVYTRGELINKVRTALGGRAAEVAYYGDELGVSTGASSDLQSATNIVRAMICDYGMDEEFGLCNIQLNNSSSAEIYTRVIERINVLLRAEMAFAVNTIKENKAIIDRLVEALMEKNSLKANEIEDILKDLKTSGIV